MPHEQGRRYTATRATRLARFALCFEFQAQNSDVGLSRACVERNDDVPLETLVEHFQLILRGFRICTCAFASAVVSSVMMWVQLVVH
jgi:hypothetical protein